MNGKGVLKGYGTVARTILEKGGFRLEILEREGKEVYNDES